MEKNEGLESKNNCQKIKDSINEKRGLFVELAAKCLDDEEFVKTMNGLLPFDNVAQAKLKIVNDASPVKSIGLTIMRMEIVPPLFSLGVSLEFAESEEKKAVSATTFIVASRTLEDLRIFVKSDSFSLQVRNNLEKQIDSLYYSMNNKKQGNSNYF